MKRLNSTDKDNYASSHEDGHKMRTLNRKQQQEQVQKPSKVLKPIQFYGTNDSLNSSSSSSTCLKTTTGTSTASASSSAYPSSLKESDSKLKSNNASSKFKSFLEEVDKAFKYDRDGFSQYNVYSTQGLAIKKYVSSRHPLNIFTFQYDTEHPGKRKFIVTSIAEFFDRYKTFEKKHHYELIREGAPCHLYFDIEYDKELNQIQEDAEILKMNLFKKLVARYLFFRFKIKISIKNDIVDLNATTLTKFSRHFIVHCPNAVFASNADVGIFVQSLVQELTLYVNHNGPTTSFHEDMKDISVDQIQQLFIEQLFSSRKRLKKLFIDTGVYSRNRQFRLLLSSKLNKDNPLVFSPGTGEDRVDNRSKTMNVDFKTFVSTLVGYVPYNINLRILSLDGYAHGVSSSTNLALPILHGIKHNHDDDNGQSAIKKLNSSPFPELDEYVLQTIAQKGGLPKFRSIIYFNDNKTVVYNVDGNRFCEHIGRHHKSNGVYYVAELLKNIFTQRCYDPDCRGFKSFPHPIPKEISPFSQEVNGLNGL